MSISSSHENFPLENLFQSFITSGMRVAAKGMEFRQLRVLEISEPATSFCRWESCGPERGRGLSKAMQLDLSQSLNQKEGYYESHIIASQMPGNLDI